MNTDTRTFAIRRGVRRTVVAAGIGLCVLTGCAAASKPSAGGPPLPSAAANARAAHAAAAGLLAKVVLPPGAVAASSDPSRAQLSQPQVTIGPSPQLIDLHRFWRVPEQPRTVKRWIEAHRPAHWTEPVWSGEGIPWGALFEPPNGSGPIEREVISSEDLVSSVAAAKGGGSALRVDAQVIWIVPRPASERVPANVTGLKITSTGDEAPARSITINEISRVRQIAEIIDGLPIEQASDGCTAPSPDPHPQVVTFSFFARPRGPAVAQAIQQADVGGAQIPCSPMSFSIDGETQTPLWEGPSALEKIGRTLGIRLTTTPCTKARTPICEEMRGLREQPSRSYGRSR